MVPLWVKFSKLPVSYWGSKTLCRIASLRGVPLYVDDCTSTKFRLSYALVLIETDITKSLLKTIAIEGEDGEIFDQEVIFEGVPPYCGNCCKLGHDCSKEMQVHKKKLTKLWVPKAICAPVVQVEYP